MQIERVEIQNFRLLQNVGLGLEDGTTLIVGRNNCGKTSIAEVFRRLLSDRTPSFRLEDFSLGSHEEFWTAFNAFHGGIARSDVAAMLPVVRVTLDISYDVDAPDLGPLSPPVFLRHDVQSSVAITLNADRFNCKQIKGEQPDKFHAAKQCKVDGGSDVRHIPKAYA